MRSHMLRRSILAATLAAGLLLALAGLRNPYAVGLVDHEAMSASQQLDVLGGTTWQQHKQCAQLGAPGGPCNLADTSCSTGSAFCWEHQVESLACADRKVYKNPTRCVQMDTEYECTEDDDTQLIVPCYDYYSCKCTLMAMTWFCIDNAQESTNVVLKCFHRPSGG